MFGQRAGQVVRIGFGIVVAIGRVVAAFDLTHSSRLQDLNRQHQKKMIVRLCERSEEEEGERRISKLRVC